MHDASDVDKLSKLYLFKSVPRRSLDELCALAPPVRFERRNEVFRQGAPADVALLVIEGRLIASVAAASGDKQVGEIRAGEIVGEQSLFVPGGRRSATVTAAEPSACLLISPDVIDHASHNPAVVAIEQFMLGTLARRIRGTNTAIQKVWKEAPTGEVEPTQPEKKAPTLRDRLASLFGGR